MQVGSILGTAVLRTEDSPLLTGAAAFVEDIQAPGALSAAFVRSTVAHAKVTALGFDDARAMPGVVGVYGAEDLDLKPFGVEDGVPTGFS
ncbi:MAG: xanthine dehydrogenase family protein molybdopterin-binding subunit, partial [Actinomycetota bacterium]